jgi:uncharacterized protein Smg (DUF494 family)
MLWLELVHQLIDTKELERLRKLSRGMMEKLEPIDELTAEINEMRIERTRRWSIHFSHTKAHLLQERK